MTHLLDDPRIPLENDHADHAPCGVVLGWTDHHSYRSRRGTEGAALLHSLIQSADRWRVESCAYLLAAARAAAIDRAAVSLPHDVLTYASPSRPRSSRSGEAKTYDSTVSSHCLAF